MAVQIQLRRGTAAQWTSANPTLAAGEVGFETDTNKEKIGDGTTAWNSLAYFGGSATPAGSSTQVQYNSSGSFAGSANLTFDGSTLTTTGVNKTIAAATQDAVQLQGRAGGTGSFAATITPTTLTASRTLTIPDANGTILQSGTAVTVAQGGTGLTAGTSGGIPYFSGTSTVASSAALTQYGVVYGGGVGNTPVSTNAGTTGQFLGANTSGAPTWQTPSGGSGAVVQVKQTIISGKNSTTTTGAFETLASATPFTPTSASNKVLVFVNGQIGNSGATGQADFQIARTIGGTTTSIITTNNIVSGQEGPYFSLNAASIYLDSPNTTSPITYLFQGKGTDGTAVAFIGGRNTDGAYNLGFYITLMEVTP